uniref:DUF732 domain-containing protein n=1 Tax=Oscillatoriales cyanobacterium SpSt-402 TaxID=2282168 RepID=A0A832H3D7_9CYAN
MQFFRYIITLLTIVILALPSPALAFTEDEGFLSELRSLSRTQSEGEVIVAMLDQIPEVFVNAAQNYCEARRDGKSIEMIEFTQSLNVFSKLGNNPVLEKAALQAIGLSDGLAARHYCPDVGE